MTKNLKLALLPAAITAAMFSNTALAGTEACFEVYSSSKSGDRVDNFHELFNGASCGTNEVGELRADNLKAVDPARVAYELTGGNNLDLDAVNQDDADRAINIAYVPTTNLPTGTFIEMSLSANAVFGENGDQLFLIKQVRKDNLPVEEYVTVASTTGATDGSNKVTFVVNSNAVEGGQRLILSRTSQIASEADIASPVVLMNNKECPIDANIAINAAATYQGQALIGSQTNSATTIVEAQRQFVFARGLSANYANDAVNPVVNSDADNLRTNFIVTVDANGNFVENVSSDKAVFETSFINRAHGDASIPNYRGLDQYVELDAHDRVGMNLDVTGNSPKSTVVGSFHTNKTGSGLTAIDNSHAGLIANEATHVEVEGSANNSIDYTGHSYSLNTGNVLFDANDVFADGQQSTRGAFLISNINEDTSMAYNYNLESDFGLFFHNREARKLIDQAYACNDPVETHDVDVNGAVIKVPYALNKGGNWVRITNEHSEPATVTVEVIDENDTAGNLREPQVVELSEAAGFDKLNAYDSVIYKMPEVMTHVRRTLGLQHSSRVSLTFTVTAPKNTVHAVSVLNTGNGVDRTMPVLDQNDWSE